MNGCLSLCVCHVIDRRLATSPGCAAEVIQPPETQNGISGVDNAQMVGRIKFGLWLLTENEQIIKIFFRAGVENGKIELC